MQKNYQINNFYLDDYQMQLLNTDQNTLVIAGAGSGKTLTIIGKVSYLISKQNINPHHILLISFTNASVNDIKQKISAEVNILTFHKLAMLILTSARINYKICHPHLLPYIISESIQTCSAETQQDILKFLHLTYSFKKFLNSPELLSFQNFIETFINLWKANDLKFSDIPLASFSKITKKILTFIFNIYKTYIEEKNSQNSLDFDDLILAAAQVVQNAHLNFEYIIIDEFQDTSQIRLNLIKELAKYTHAKIIVVGDDWQSIYRFSGCNLNLFLNFSHSFSNVFTMKLVNTYRNSQELIDIAKKFIEKNPKQIAKQLKSSKSVNIPLIFVPYENANAIDTLKKVIKHLLTLSNDIMILSRNNKDILNYIDSDYTLNGNILTYQNHVLKYYTVHKSKGLESEYVIILNCNNSTLGFPNQIEDNPLINKIMPSQEIRFAEERRLFYVAITRCKEQTFLLYDKHNPSIFIKEIKKITKKCLKKITYFKSKGKYQF